MTRKFAVWAPSPSRVDLVLDGSRMPMRRGPDDWWRAEAPATADASYGFSLDGGPPRPDPRGRRLPDGPHGLSQLFDPAAFSWSDQAWAGVSLSETVVYEVHVGTFTDEGTLGAALGKLSHLVELGVGMVELLPLAPFPGRHGWGYDGVAPYAVHEPYGGPAGLQRFVDAAHAHCLGVCLDVVYNHLGPDGSYLDEFGPYLTDHHHTPWGRAVNMDAPGSDEVRSWVLDNALQWFSDFHVDALRLDAVHELKDDRATSILEELSERTDALAVELGRPLTLIAESDRNDPRTVTPRDRGGLGLHAQWADDVHHALHVALTGETQGYYADFADPGALGKALRSPYFHDGSYSSFRGRCHGRPIDPSTPGWRFVASLQTHDQVGNRAGGERLSALLDPDRLACAAAILLASPWTPMLFMGEEWGATTPWQFFTDHTDARIARSVTEGRRREFGGHGWGDAAVPDPQDPATFTRSRLDWSEPAREPHRALLRWYAALVRLRSTEPDLHDGRLDRVVVEHDPDSGRLVLRRGSVAVLANLGTEDQVFAATGDVLLSWPEPVAATEQLLLRPGFTAVVRG